MIYFNNITDTGMPQLAHSRYVYTYQSTSCKKNDKFSRQKTFVWL